MEGKKKKDKKGKKTSENWELQYTKMTDINYWQWYETAMHEDIFILQKFFTQHN